MAAAPVMMVGPYLLQDVLGKGQTGIVRVGVHSVTKKKVAVKIIDRTKLAPHILSKVEREIAIMKLIDHPNVLGLYDVYENKRHLYLVLEHISGGELFEYLVKKGKLSLHEARKFFRQIISAVGFCHQHLVCHRDLKPENLLLDDKKNIKIADFGMASVQLGDIMLETSCGSPHYACPEVIKGIKYDGKKADVWSCGVILYALVVGCLPFDDDNLRQLLEKVKNGVFLIPPFVPTECRNLMLSMIKINPQERYTMAEVKRHPFLKSETLPPEPPIQEVVKPKIIKEENEIDADIVNSMTSLGCFKDKVQLTEKLLQDENTLERVIYFLLMDRKSKIRIQDDDLGVMNLSKYQADPPRKRSEHGSLQEDSLSSSHKSPAKILTKRRAMTYHGESPNTTRANRSSSSYSDSSPPSSPMRAKIFSFKKSGAGGGSIFNRRRSGNSEPTLEDQDNFSAGSTPDLTVKKSIFSSLLFHIPSGNVEPFVMEFNDRTMKVLKADLTSALLSTPQISHSSLSPSELRVIYKKRKGIYHRKTYITVRFVRQSEESECSEAETPIILKVLFLDGSHRRFRKVCEILQTHLRTSKSSDEVDFSGGSDGSFEHIYGLNTAGRKNSQNTDSTFHSGAHSTENLLDG